MGVSIPRHGGVMVVCTANQARSPVAAALLGDRLERETGGSSSNYWSPVRSAGVDAADGSPLLDSMAAALRRRGMEAFPHASRTLTPDLVQDVRLIIAMTEAHRHRVNRMCADAVPRSFTLKELDRLLSSPQWQHSDPAAGDIVERLHFLRPLVSRPGEPEDVVDPALGHKRLATAVLDELVSLVGRVATQLARSSVPGRGPAAHPH